MASRETNGKLVRNDGVVFNLSGATNVVGFDTLITANKCLAYSLPAGMDWSWLEGKKIEITVDGEIAKTTIHTLFDGGEQARVYRNSAGTWKCKFPDPTTGSPIDKACTDWGTPAPLRWQSPTQAVIVLPVAPSQLIFGNQMYRFNEYFIDRSIRSIRILE